MKLLTMLVELFIVPLCELHTFGEGWAKQVMGHGRGGQTLDIMTCASQVLEKGRDRQNCGAVATLDVRSYHDSIPFGVALRGLRHRGISADWARAAIRLHRCPKFVMQIGTARTRAMRKSRGVTTGNSLAALLGKVIMQDVMEYVRPALLPLCFQIRAGAIAPMVWSDNVVSFAKTAEAGIEMICSWKSALWEVARCEVKQGSAVVVPSSIAKCRAHQVIRQELAINIRPAERILGMYVTCNGSDVANRKLLLGRVAASFAKNCSILCRDSISEETRLRFWESLMRGALHGAALLKPMLETCVNLASANNRVIRRMLGIQRVLGESLMAHRRHVNVEVTYVREEMGIDIEREFVKCIVRWCGHIARHPDSQTFILLHEQGDNWLHAQRNQRASGRPGTRAQAGFTSRWAEGWHTAADEHFREYPANQSGWVFPKKHHFSIIARTNFLIDLIHPPAGPNRAIADEVLELSLVSCVFSREVD